MVETQSLYVLDTFALMAHFEAEKGGEKVRELLKQAEAGDTLVTGDPEFKTIKQNLSLVWLNK